MPRPKRSLELPSSSKTIVVRRILTSTGLNAGFVPLTPNQAARISNFWVPRRADLSSGWMLDYQDEFAFRDKRGAGIAGARLAV